MNKTTTWQFTWMIWMTKMHTRFFKQLESASLTVIEISSLSSASDSSNQADGCGSRSLLRIILTRRRFPTFSSSGHNESCTKKISSHCLRLREVSFRKLLLMSGTTWLMTMRDKLHLTISLAPSMTMSLMHLS
jgi:hypothetical protein